ncbi:MAG: malonyl-CoA decarboxylase family protein, partial [Gammaproteobacteria bacterium]
IAAILENDSDSNRNDFKTATFYSISNCQPGLKNISFGNFLIKQVVQELQAEFPSIKSFVTLSPVSGMSRWLDSSENEDTTGLHMLKEEVKSLVLDPAVLEQHDTVIKRLVFNYLLTTKRGIYPFDSVARFHLGNGASLHQINTNADTSKNGLKQSRGAMVNYLYDLRYLERNHESYITEGEVHYNDKLKSLLIKE